ncbi:COG4315 family predicted lipoprotein [Arthrobacter sp. CG_A4]|uniref:COG4315 family predicted lipoprotein n=1 Tax=Arthrobacter sp. CG_A4 TaxID=3071706 RepID=UPI002E0BE9F9|nr:putative lipoprotein with Yx(FWY)xxD motif [Arthrobacter sp. CG_A4]
MKKHLSIGLSAFAVAALLSGCAGGSGTSTTSTPATTSPSAASSAPASTPAAAAAALKVASSKLGQIVVDGKGMSVYYFTKDTKDSGTSACTGGCLTAWPPVVTTSAAPTVDGVTGKVGTIATPDGKKQVTINGMPIYYFAKDKAAGDVLGQGVNSVWYVVAPSGEMITTAAGS